jgi:integral membrane sensor domain MASE1
MPILLARGQNTEKMMILFRKFGYPGDFFHKFQRLLGKEMNPYLEPRNLATVALLTLAYYIVGRIGLRSATPNHSVTAIWLPAGISLAALLLRGKRVWPGIFIGTLLLSIKVTGIIPISIGFAIGNTLEALLGAYLVNKYANGVNAFFKARDVLRFVVFGGMLAPAFCATFGVSLLCLGGLARPTDFSMLWFVWWVGDMLGVLFLTPFLVLLLGHRHHASGLAEQIEIAFLIAGLSIVCLLNFGPRSAFSIPGNSFLFLCAPFLAWSALRFCPLEAAGATMVMGGFALWGSAHGFGPFENSTGLPLFVGVFMAVGTATTMTIAAANAEQKNATKDVLGMYFVLKEVKEGEIRGLQDTVAALQLELARNGHDRTGGATGDTKNRGGTAINFDRLVP